MSATDEDLISYAQFVASKFSSNRDGWVYSRDKGDLKHIRYERDYTGDNHWTKRLRRAFDPSLLLRRRKRGAFDFTDGSLRSRLLFALAWVRVSIRKDDNLPDGQINGNLTFWEEDGEYIALFQPLVGMKVLDFLRDEPNNPHARAIIKQMHTCIALGTADGR